MKYTPRKYFAHNLATGVVTTAKVGKKIVTTDSGDPAASDDTGEGYIVGSMWINTTSGEQFVATGVGAEDAVWKGQKGEDINFSTAWQGLTNVYEIGGNYPGPTPSTDAITRYPLAAPYPQSDVGEMAQAGWTSGVYVGPGNVGFIAGSFTPGNTLVSEVASFPTASGGPGVTTSDQGELNQGGWVWGGNGWSPTHGYTIGGIETTPWAIVSEISDFTFASFSSSDTGAEMYDDRRFHASADDATHTYQFAGWNPGVMDGIERYQKGTSTTASDTGELTIARYGVMGNSDVAGGYGYASGGGGPPPIDEIDVIQRFPFASSTPSTDIGEASKRLAYGTHRGGSSMTHGHTSSRDRPGPGGPGGGTTRDRFAFASTTSGTDIGEVANEGNANDDVGMTCV